jgi:hypothetical protein
MPPQDLILIMLDATKDDKQIEILESELHTVGIRLNSQPPDIYYKPKKVRASTMPLGSRHCVCVCVCERRVSAPDVHRCSEYRVGDSPCECGRVRT